MTFVSPKGYWGPLEREESQAGREPEQHREAASWPVRAGEGGMGSPGHLFGRRGGEGPALALLPWSRWVGRLPPQRRSGGRCGSFPSRPR